MMKAFIFGDVSRACSLCRRDHKACNGARPCQRCTASGTGHMCEDIPLKKRGRPVRKKRPASSTEAGVANFVSSFPQPTISPQAIAKTEECFGDISNKFKLLQQKLQSANHHELQFHNIHPEPRRPQQPQKKKQVSPTTTKTTTPCQSSSAWIPLPSPPVSPTYRPNCASPTLSPPSSPSTSASTSSVLKKRKREASAIPTVFVPDTPPPASLCYQQPSKVPCLEERERNANAITSIEERNAEEFVLEVTENRKACEGLLSELLSVFPDGLDDGDDSFLSFTDTTTSFGFDEGCTHTHAQQPQQPQQAQQPQQQVCQFEDLMPESFWIPSMFDGDLEDRDGDDLSFFSTEESPFTSILC